MVVVIPSLSTWVVMEDSSILDSFSVRRSHLEEKRKGV